MWLYLPRSELHVLTLSAECFNHDIQPGEAHPILASIVGDNIEKTIFEEMDVLDDALKEELEAALQEVLEDTWQFYTLARIRDLALIVLGLGSNKRIRERAAKLALAIMHEVLQKHNGHKEELLGASTTYSSLPPRFRSFVGHAEKTCPW